MHIHRCYSCSYIYKYIYIYLEVPPHPGDPVLICIHCNCVSVRIPSFFFYPLKSFEQKCRTSPLTKTNTHEKKEPQAFRKDPKTYSRKWSEIPNLIIILAPQFGAVEKHGTPWNHVLAVVCCCCCFPFLALFDVFFTVETVWSHEWSRVYLNKS